MSPKKLFLKKQIGLFLSLSFSLSLIALFALGFAPITLADTTDYGYKQPSSDGIGKVYLGREISQVMGHQGAGWLERSKRLSEERPDLAVELLELAPTDTVADIGAGSGYITFKLADQVQEGQVLAVDVQPEMIEQLEKKRDQQRVSNVETILGTEMDPKLSPESIDLAVMVDAYHEFAYPLEMMSGLVEALRPGGRVVLAEYRAENPLIMIKRLHKMAEKQVKREMAAVGLQWLKTDEHLPQQHLLFFEKPSNSDV